MNQSIRCKRIYEPSSDEDGYRVLIDRLWPRGMSKQEAAVDLWFKQIAPSPDLRQWFDHKPERFKEFAERYRDELNSNPAAKELSDIIAEKKKVTLLYAAREEHYNHATVLLQVLGS